MSSLLSRSVSLRLILLSVSWIVAALIVGGLVLDSYFSDHVEQSFDADLRRQMDEVLSNVEVIDGQLVLRQRPTNPSFHRPLSGWYWQVSFADEAVQRSRSMWDQVLDDLPAPPRGVTKSAYITGPRGETLRALSETFKLSTLNGDITITIAGPAQVITYASHEFGEALTTSLVVLGIGLILAVVLQVFLGLKPLKMVRQKLLAIHDGKITRMDGTFPSEVEPLVNDLNKLLEHNAQVIERARTHTGNLAHALKTPLAVLGNHVDNLGGDDSKIVTEQLATMNDLVKRHLARARAAGGLAAPGQVTTLDDLLVPLQRTLMRIYQHHNDEAGVNIVLSDLTGLSVAGEREDLDEMLGNLMDNACKWAVCQVHVSAYKDGRNVVILVEDDGPGIPEGLREEVLQRGRRLDEATPGSGLGLNIVLELAELYHGTLKLGDAALGGLQVRLQLPAV
ncbi:MAG: sensor histidine kinase [Magnetovibrio sp.]|nr:sensor histidine kinase [Magnetovibrio sp.]